MKRSCGGDGKGRSCMGSRESRENRRRVRKRRTRKRGAL